MLLSAEEFRKFLEPYLSDLDINEKVAMLGTIRTDYINELENDLIKDYTLCYGCFKYYPKSDKITRVEEETAVETIITDCGYGDNDVLADVTRQTLYEVCPLCGYKESKISHILEMKNRGTRWERQYGKTY